MKNYKVLSDHYSAFKKGGYPALVAKKNDKVELIELRGKVALVKNSLGDKFSIHESKLIRL